MEDVISACRGTAKTLGANSLEALNFGEACFNLRNCINKDLQTQARKTILGTVLYGKKFEVLLEEAHGIAKRYEKHNPPLIGEITLMTLEQAKKEFSYQFVKEILSSLITKQYHMETQKFG